MNRRRFLRDTGGLAASLILAPAIHAQEPAFPVVRISLGKRKFHSPAVEDTIARVKSAVANEELAWLFGNCFPNTLDTTVDFELVDGRPDTYVITGDIDAMWLRDSSAQVWPYLPLMKDDASLQQLIAGVINRHTRCILKDPYANGFYKDDRKSGDWKSDQTDIKSGVHERKWELDSLCYPIRLAYQYWKSTNDTEPFDAFWRAAILRTLQTLREQQRKNDKGPYRFQRRTTVPSDTLAGNGYGLPVKPVGLVCSMFRPSDDATLFPFLVPANFFAVISLRQAAVMLEQIHHDPATAAECRRLAQEIESALRQYAIVDHPKFGRVLAYEVDGFGSSNFMDDGNVPSLLSLPYLGAVKPDDRVYLNTRRFVLSEADPYYYKGKAAEGPGGPHAGPDMIWPLGLIVQALTTTDEAEIRRCLDVLRRTHAGTGFMHEAFNKDDPAKYTRGWFAWANSLFGELILKLFKDRPRVLD